MKKKTFIYSTLLLVMMVLPIGLVMVSTSKAQGVTLKIIVTDQQAPGVEAVVDDFLAVTDGVDAVEVVASGTRADDQLTYLTTLLAAGDSEFDVIGLDTVWTAQFAENGWIKDLTADLESGEMDNYFGGMVQSCTYDGKIWAYPYFMNLGVLFYRNDIITRNGFTIDDFDTWDEFKTNTNKILANTTEQELNPDLVGFVGQFDAYEGGVCNFIEWIGSAGVTSIFDENGNPNLNTTDVQGAMEFLKGLVAPRYTGVQGTGYIIPRAGLTHDEGSSVGMWLAGNAIFMRQWPFAYGLSEDTDILNATDGSGNYIQFGVTAMPTKTGSADEKSSVVGGAILAINSYSTHQDLALKLIRFLGNTTAQNAELTECSNFPALKSVFDDLPAGFEWVSKFKDAADRTLSRPVHPKYPEISTEIADKFNDILGGVKSVEKGLGEMDTAISEIISGGPTSDSVSIPGYTWVFMIAFMGLTAGTLVIIKKKH
ncbi:MAG: extracellular solute-binding protein [Candidatus Lokiarchaeota archaeon]|nr:extracellular solute-binding protein [Candidatus Harpocratesius repetitus]